MAKTSNKTTTPKAEAKPKADVKPKAEAKPKAEPKAKAQPKPAVSSAEALEQASDETLKTFKSLGIEQQLQSELEWCLGSYRFDKNPSGLYEVAKKALIALNDAKSKKTKGVTSKLVSDLEKALKTE